MWSHIIVILLLVSAAIMLSVSVSTGDWQLLGYSKKGIQTLKNIDKDLSTHIGIWEICPHHPKRPCHSTEADHKQWALIAIRVTSILSIILCLLALVLKDKWRVVAAGLSAILSFKTCLLYSTQLENFFSQDFDVLMNSQYGYSFYMQAGGSLFIMIAIFISCIF